MQLNKISKSEHSLFAYLYLAFGVILQKATIEGYDIEPKMISKTRPHSSFMAPAGSIYHWEAFGNCTSKITSECGWKCEAYRDSFWSSRHLMIKGRCNGKKCQCKSVHM